MYVYIYSSLPSIRLSSSAIAYYVFSSGTRERQKGSKGSTTQKSGQCLMFSDKTFESRKYDGSREDELSSKDLDAESYCVMETCTTGQHSAPGCRSLCRGSECDPGPAEIPESSRNGEKCAALEQQPLRNLGAEMEPRIRSVSLLLCTQSSFLHRPRKK